MKMALGKQIRHYRDKMKWELKKLSEQSDVDIGTLSALEVRDSKRSQYAIAIAKAFGLTLEQLSDEGTDYDLSHLQSKPPMTFPNDRDAAPVSKSIAAEPTFTHRRKDHDSWTLEAIDIMSQLDDGQKQAMVAKMREYKQYLGPPRDGQALFMAA